MKTPIKFLHDCMLIKDILVIGDLHIGYGNYFYGKSDFPGSQLKDIKDKLGEVFSYLKEKNIKIKKVVLLGDVKHHFGTITDVEWRDTLEFFDFLKDNIDDKGRVIIVKGNHDNILKPIVKKRDILLKDYYKLVVDGKKWCFLHGYKLFEQCLDSDYLVFGHLHPAITLHDNYKNEKYKCFLKGKWKNKEVFVLPSFSSVSLGYDLNDIGENLNSKFFVVPNKSLKNFEVVIYNNDEKKEYNFGKLNGLI